MLNRNNENLFEHAGHERMQKEQPLAARMRPRTLEEYIGQDHILAPGRLLRRAIQADQISSLIFYGPPGTGKTTLAGVIANTTKSEFRVLNAVMAGVKDVREVTEKAHRLRLEQQRRTILFVDEVHRWNKAQQDGLLPWVENGTIILIGATTENPYFSVNKALVSRSRIFQLKPLTLENQRQVLASVLKDKERGYGNLDIEIKDNAAEHLADVANGDARALLNAVELAVETTSPDENGKVFIDLSVAEESIQRRAVLYDKEGDYHFDTISAFIKSLRGSDPDAAVYWMAKMVHAGEDPRYIFRRMIIFCCEDVGLADPNAISIVTSCADAFDRVGMPEGRFMLGQAAIYLATTKKSNSVFAFFDALNAVDKEMEDEVPNHLKDASRDKKGFGHGVGYLYPHAYKDHWVEQQYLPTSMQGKVFYTPSDQGYEEEIGNDVRRRREAQLAAALENDICGAPPEILTFSPEDRAYDRWLNRTVSGFSSRLSAIRDSLFEKASCSRHARVLDLSASDGLFTWEALRRVPEGGVWALAPNPRSVELIEHQATKCPDLNKPVILQGALQELKSLLNQTDFSEVQFEVIIGRNILGQTADRESAATFLTSLCAKHSRICLSETISREGQRLYELIEPQLENKELISSISAIEEEVYNNPEDILVNWSKEDAQLWFNNAGCSKVNIETFRETSPIPITDSMINRWFSPGSNRLSYADRLAEKLSPKQMQTVERAFRSLRGRTVDWETARIEITAVHDL